MSLQPKGRVSSVTPSFGALHNMSTQCNQSMHGDQTGGMKEFYRVEPICRHQGQHIGEKLCITNANFLHLLAHASTTSVISDAFALSLTSVQPTSLAHHSYTQSSITATHCTMVFQKPS